MDSSYENQEINQKVNDEKEIKFAYGKMAYFDIEAKYRPKPSLYFIGDIIDADNPMHIKRNIKTSKYFKCYDKSTKLELSEEDFPKNDMLYECSLQLEIWEWGGNTCMRALAIEVGECLGKNNGLKSKNNNPFDDIRPIQ